MADEGGGAGRSDVLFIVVVILFVAAAWYFTGGPEKDTRNLFLPPSSIPGTPSTIGVPTVDTSGGYGDIDTVTNEVAAVRTELASLQSLPASPYAGQVQIVSASDGSAAQAKREFITIRAKTTNTERIAITGWRVESAISGRTAYIGQGSDVYRPGQSGNEIIFLNPGDEAVISSGRSPVGASFRVNACSGYLSQFQDFTPALPLNCPAPEQEALSADRSVYTDNDCMDYLERLRVCTIDINPPPSLSNACRAFVQTAVTYQGCLARHSNDPDFRGRQWRVYLGYTDELWREKREVIALLDAQGRLVDSSTY